MSAPETATGSLHAFRSLSAVEESLGRLMEHPAGPLAVRLPRQPGWKEPRYAHQLCSLLPGAELVVIDDAAHGAIGEKSNDVTAAIGDFLAKH